MFEKKNIKLEEKNQNLENRLKQVVVAPVAFAASLTQTKQILCEHQAIEYDNVITNLGNAYDPRHGHFTAPVKGLYLFSVTLMSPYGSNPNDINAELVKNGVQTIPLYATSLDSYSTSATVLLTLNAGDMVWVRSFYVSTQTIHGRVYDIFPDY
ncbi:hypothetical protein KUTeg_020302 [Tegillarca granosa]|uniref:C1q domain-containing protein n=1 Tax=Tegillarca granosa TaxID=220873 RepID=A0ABQ9ECU0_TEGGR|nr:hypothetical protein KUTeg_020302 [Tegillarca granosa]